MVLLNTTALRSLKKVSAEAYDTSMDYLGIGLLTIKMRVIEHWLILVFF